jgi:hypothetical protein
MLNRVSSKIIEMHRIVQCAEQRFNLPAATLWLRLLQRYIFDQFSLQEIRAYAVLASDVVDTYPVLISKEGSLKKLARINSQRLQWQTENKEKFYEICESRGIGFPKVCAIIGGGRQTWKHELPTDFICKDIAGAYGSGFAVFKRIGVDEVKVNNGPTEKLESVLQRLTAGGSKLLLQERLFDHPDLQAISGRPTLQTIRIVTFRDADGTHRMLYWLIKLVIGSNISDNIAYGKTGNVIAFGDRSSGNIKAARTLHPSGAGLHTIYNHPESNRALNEFAVPLWQEAVDMVLNAHRFFPDFRALGWDVAVTPEGPKILEANAWWDPPRVVPQLLTPEDWRTIFG